MPRALSGAAMTSMCTSQCARNCMGYRYMADYNTKRSKAVEENASGGLEIASG